MGFDITGGATGFGDALLIVLAISIAIPVLIAFVVITKRARDDVVDRNDHDLEA